MLAAGAVACVRKDESLDAIAEAVRAAAGRSRADGAHGGEHGDRPRLDGRLPRGAGAVPELAGRPALRPVRRRELPRLRRARPAEFYERLRRRRPRCRRPRSRRRATSSRPTRSSPRTSASSRCTSPRSSPGRSRAPAAAAEELGDGKVRVIDTGTVSAGAGDARARRAAAARARDDRRGGRRAVERFQRRVSGSSSPSRRSSTSPGAAGSGRRRRWPATLLHIKPILEIEDGEVVPRKRVRGKPQGVPRVRATLFEAGTTDRPSLRVGIAHADAPERLEALRELVRRTRPQAQTRGRDDARRRRRHARRPWRRRPLLVRRRRLLEGLVVAARAAARRSRQAVRRSQRAPAIVAPGSRRPAG